MFGWGAFTSVNAEKLSSPESEAHRKREMEIERLGIGICRFCGDDIVKNTDMPGGGWTWESEILLGFCDQAGTQGKHKPLVIIEEVEKEDE